MGEWAKSIILKNPDSTAIWTVTFHDLIDLAERELERYDGIMAKTHKYVFPSTSSRCYMD